MIYETASSKSGFAKIKEMHHRQVLDHFGMLKRDLTVRSVESMRTLNSTFRLDFKQQHLRINTLHYLWNLFIMPEIVTYSDLAYNVKGLDKWLTDNLDPVSYNFYTPHTHSVSIRQRSSVGLYDTTGSGYIHSAIAFDNSVDLMMFRIKQGL